MHPPFIAARPDARWAGTSRGYRGSSEGVTLDAHRRWWGKRWILASEAPFPVPEPVLLFASRRGMDHGFWRDFRVGDPVFDRRHFVFTDTPALLPMIVGPATREALGINTALDDALTLYVLDGVSRVTGLNDVEDGTAVTRHLAVHRALAADHETFLSGWETLVTAVHGRAEASWPPRGTLINPVGALRIYLSWTPGTVRDVDWLKREDSLRTIVAGQDGRTRPRWSLREAEPFEQSHLELARREFLVTGKPPIARPLLEQLVDRADLVSITCGAEVRVAVRGVATAAQLAGMVRMIEQVLQAPDSGSPYR